MDEKQKDEYIAQLESIIAMMPGLVYWKGKDGKFLGCNNNEAKVLNLSSPAEIVGKQTHEMTTEELAPALLANDEKVMATGEECFIEEIGLNQHGNNTVYLTQKSPLRNSQGEIIGLVGVSFDIDDRKKMEEELKQTKEQLQEITSKLENILSLIPGHVYWKDKDGRFLGCNDNFAETLHLSSRTEIIGKYDTDFIDEELAKPVMAIDQEVIRHNTQKTIEEHVIDKDGNPATYLSQKSPLKDSAGNIIGLVGVSFDITKRKQMEKELENTQKQLEKNLQEKTKFIENMSYLDNIISLIPGTVYWKDKQGRHLGCNDNMAKIFKLSSRQEIIGKTAAELIGADLAKEVDLTDQKVIDTNTEIKLEEKGFDTSGNLAVYLSRKAPIRNEEGKVIGLLGMSLDITEIKKTEIELKEAKEHAEAANKAKTNFLAMISHELRIPLTGILGMAQLLDADDTLSSEQHEEINDILSSGKHLLELVDDLLDITKLEAGKMELHPTPVNVKTLIEEIAVILLPKAKQKNINFLVEYEEKNPNQVIIDARVLKQVLLNIIGNAIKFTKKGHVRIQVNYNALNSTQGNFIFTVEDTGAGIPEDKLEAIFERFNQADTSITRQYGGTGLGLTICKAYAELMNATITVKSTLDKGSIFTFNTPVKLYLDTSHLTNTTSSFHRAREETSTTALKILLVEDDPVVSKVHKTMLEKLGCIVETADNGKKALDMFAHCFDLVFMDIGLPDISGYEVTTALRQYENNNNLSRTPVIALTGYAQEEFHIKCLAAGMDEVITKPTELKRFAEVLKKYR